MARTELELVAGGEGGVVMERIAAFYARYPEGRIITELVSHGEAEVTFRARVYRYPDDPRPAATGWASAREADGTPGGATRLERAETTAIGRALANLGILRAGRWPQLAGTGRVVRRVAEASPGRAAVAARAVRATRTAGDDRAVHDTHDEADTDAELGAVRGGRDAGATRAGASRRAALPLRREAGAPSDALADAFRLLREAERAGMAPGRVASLRRRLQAHPPPDEAAIRALEASLRDFLGRRFRERLSVALGAMSGGGDG